MASPDINTEDFMAAVDFLSVQENVDPERIGILGICGWGGMALNAATLDTRIKATVASTMYDMTRVNAKGNFDALALSLFELFSFKLRKGSKHGQHEFARRRVGIAVATILLTGGYKTMTRDDVVTVLKASL